MHIVFLTRSPAEASVLAPTQHVLPPVHGRLRTVAQVLSEQGHRVQIFCPWVSEPTRLQGVDYRPVQHLAKYARQNSLDFFITVDDESALKLGIKARHVLAWVHRDFSEIWHEAPDLRAQLSQLLSQRADKVLALSHWQAQCLQNFLGLAPEHICVLPVDGFSAILSSVNPAAEASESEIHSDNAENGTVHLVYSGAPYHGLVQTLAVFKRLQAVSQCPLQLHVYRNLRIYGLPLSEALAEIYAHPDLQESGIHLHDMPTSLAAYQAELARYDLWLYPHHAAPPFAFEPGYQMNGEVCSQDLYLAQWAGLATLVTPHGGLAEFLPSACRAECVIPLTEDLEAFVQNALACIDNPQKRRRLGVTQRDHARALYTSAEIARAWNAMMDDFRSSRAAAPALTSPFSAPLVSVIIPTYNRARNLEHCLNALTTQTHSAFEVIICDDGSTDQTPEVVQRFSDRLNLRYRWQEDLGFRAAEARNMGIRLSRGKYLVFLDSDIVVPPTFVAAHQQALEAHPNVAVNSYIYRMQAEIDEDLGLPPATYIPKHRDILKPDSRDRYQLFERHEPIEETYFLDSNALSMRRKDMERVGFFDSAFVGWGHEDTELGYRLASHGMSLVLIQEGATAYHQYHYVSEHKDDERAVNWQRLTQKYGITRWYDPLWELEISMPIPVQADEQAAAPQQGRWLLKTGDAFPVHGIPLVLQVDQGVLTGIEKYSFKSQ